MTTPLAEWRDVAVRYAGAARDAVGPVSLTVGRGERVLLLGASGSGKSSLLLALTGLIPGAIPGVVRGARRIDGRDAAERSPADWADSVAFLFQSPERNLCGMRVAEEVAFALEQRRLPEGEIKARAERALAAVGLGPEAGARRVAALSGGEKQRVALAAILAQGADLLLIDEPTAHLDAEAAARVRAALAWLGPRRGALIVDHRLDGLLDVIDRVVALDGHGRKLAEGPPRLVFRAARARLEALGVWTPATTGLDAALEAAGAGLEAMPLNAAEIVEALDAAPAAARRRARAVVGRWLVARSGGPRRPTGGVVARLHDAACAAPCGRPVLSNVSLELRAGAVTALIGPNGAGKSTLALALAGLAPLAAGRREGPPGGMIFQNPEHVFTKGSIRDEIAMSAPDSADAAAVAGMLAVWGLTGLERRHPLDLSEGQKRRLALAVIAVAPRWPLLVLDEPTAGLDAAGAAFLERRLRQLADEGRTLALVTHDVDLARRLADVLVVVRDGRAREIGGAEALDDPETRARWGLPAPLCAPLRAWLASEGAARTAC